MEYPSLGKPPAGSIRFNTDSSKMEIYNGDKWWNIDSTSPQEQTGGARGMTAGGSEPGAADHIDYWNIATTGNAADFGDITTNTEYHAAGQGSSRTRANFAGGRTPSKTANTEHYDGTSWTEVNDLSTARSDSYAGGGTATSTLLAGGETSTAYTNVTEEFTAPTDFTKQNLGQVYYNLARDYSSRFQRTTHIDGRLLPE